MSMKLSEDEKQLDGTINAAIVDPKDKSAQMVFDVTLSIDTRDTEYLIVTPESSARHDINYDQMTAALTNQNALSMEGASSSGPAVHESQVKPSTSAAANAQVPNPRKTVTMATAGSPKFNRPAINSSPNKSAPGSATAAATGQEKNSPLKSKDGKP